MPKDFSDKAVDALMEASETQVLDNVTLAAMLRNVYGRLKKLEAKKESKAKTSESAPAM